MKLYDNTQNNDYSLSGESSDVADAITVQRAHKTAEMSQVQLIDKLVDVLVSTQEQGPAARVAR